MQNRRGQHDSRKRGPCDGVGGPVPLWSSETSCFVTFLITVKEKIFLKYIESKVTRLRRRTKLSATDVYPLHFLPPGELIWVWLTRVGHFWGALDGQHSKNGQTASSITHPLAYCLLPPPPGVAFSNFCAFLLSKYCLWRKYHFALYNAKLGPRNNCAVWHQYTAQQLSPVAIPLKYWVETSFSLQRGNYFRSLGCHTQKH